jgi:hypothetical protein
MTDATKVPASPRGLRTATIICAVAVFAAAAALAGCSAGSPGAASSGGPARTGFGTVHGPARAPLAASAAGPATATGQAGPVVEPVVEPARLVLAQSIIYTASLTVRTGNVPDAAQRAAAIAASAGGYPAEEQESSQPGQRQVSAASLELKIPVPAYQAALGRLRTELGTPTSLSQQAEDVTQQVADVASRVASAQAAIAQLRALLSRAGSVGDLLSVQDQINSQESDLEALQAQQRALAHATTFATVSLLLVAQHPVTVKKAKGHGFVSGLSAGWRGLRRATTWLLGAVGAALPFAVIIALAGGLGYLIRRRLQRRRARPTTAE